MARLRELFPQSAPRAGSQDYLTYPAHAPILQLDYLFLPEPYAVERFHVLETLASDHRPVLVKAVREKR